MAILPDPNFPTQFPRYDEEAGVPDEDPPFISHDQPRVTNRFQSVLQEGRLVGPTIRSAIVTTPTVLSVEITYSRYGVAQPFCITLARNQFEALIKSKGYKSVVAWLQSGDDIQCEVFFTSTLYLPHQPISMQLGRVDVNSTNMAEDEIKLTCRDLADDLIDQSVFLSLNPAPSTVKLVKALADNSLIRTSALSSSGKLFSTVQQNGAEQQFGILDHSGDGKWLVITGDRAWDIIQAAGRLDDADAFILNGTLWYINADVLRSRAGNFFLTYGGNGQGGNIVDLDYEHSLAQSGSGRIAVLMSISNTINPSPTGKGTAYILMEDITEGPKVIPTVPRHLSVLSSHRGIKVYHVARYNISNQSALEAAIREVISLFREVSSKEMVVNVTTAGCPLMTPLDTYYIRNPPDSSLENVPLVADHITHDFGPHGYSTKLVLSNFREIVVS